MVLAFKFFSFFLEQIFANSPVLSFTFPHSMSIRFIKRKIICFWNGFKWKILIVFELILKQKHIKGIYRPFKTENMKKLRKNISVAFLWIWHLRIRIKFWAGNIAISLFLVRASLSNTSAWAKVTHTVLLRVKYEHPYIKNKLHLCHWGLIFAIQNAFREPSLDKTL